MEYEVDNNYQFETDDNGTPYLPQDMTRDGNLYVLPNGKYLPCGFYICEDGSGLIYEPRELSFFGKLIESQPWAKKAKGQ